MVLQPVTERVLHRPPGAIQHFRPELVQRRKSGNQHDEHADHHRRGDAVQADAVGVLDPIAIPPATSVDKSQVGEHRDRQHGEQVKGELELAKPVAQVGDDGHAKDERWRPR